MPEAFVPVSGELIFACQLLQWLLLPHSIITGNVFKDRRLEHKEAAVDPHTIAFGFFAERENFILVCGELDTTKTPRRLNCCYCCFGAASFMKADEFCDVHGGKAIAIGEAESIFANILLNF